MTTTDVAAVEATTTTPTGHAHLHAHQAKPGCVAPCGYVWRNSSNPERSIDSPCPRCMEISMTGALGPEHACHNTTQES